MLTHHLASFGGDILATRATDSLTAGFQGLLDAVSVYLEAQRTPMCMVLVVVTSSCERDSC